ncbi:hypothetical protein ACTA71_010738 [Dictyostelium dimigraforme]
MKLKAVLVLKIQILVMILVASLHSIYDNLKSNESILIHSAAGRIVDLGITHLTPNDHMTNNHYKFNMSYNNVEVVDFSGKLIKGYLKKIIKMINSNILELNVPIIEYSNNQFKDTIEHINQRKPIDSNKVNQVLNKLELKENIRNIDSIIYFAFMNDIGEVQQVDMNRSNNIHGVKTTGTINLHNQSINRSWNIKQFIMASSVVSIFGSDQQCCYTFTWITTLAINLGAIASTGFVSRNNVIETMFKSSILKLFSPQPVVSSLDLFIQNQHQYPNYCLSDFNFEVLPSTLTNHFLTKWIIIQVVTSDNNRDSPQPICHQYPIQLDLKIPQISIVNALVEEISGISKNSNDDSLSMECCKLDCADYENRKTIKVSNNFSFPKSLDITCHNGDRVKFKILGILCHSGSDFYIVVFISFYSSTKIINFINLMVQMFQYQIIKKLLLIILVIQIKTACSIHILIGKQLLETGVPSLIQSIIQRKYFKIM